MDDEHNFLDLVEKANKKHQKMIITMLKKAIEEADAIPLLANILLSFCAAIGSSGVEKGTMENIKIILKSIIEDALVEYKK